MKKINYIYPIMAVVMFLSAYLLANLNMSWDNSYEHRLTFVRFLLFFGYVSIIITMGNYIFYLLGKCSAFFKELNQYSKENKEEHE